jgi:Ca-activated chloride channel family protein
MGPSALSFASPALLWTLLLVPAAVAAYQLMQRRRARYAVRFTNVDLLANLVAQSPGWRRHLPAALYLGALAALLISLARPQALVPVPKDDATVLLVMDTSGSMAATDVGPTRLQAAQAAGKTFLDELPSRFRVGVVAFSNAPQTLLRPTTDRAAAGQALNLLRADGGTAMGDALVQAITLTQDGASGAGQTGRTALATGRAGLSAPLPPTPAAQDGSTDHAPAAILLLSDGANTAGRTSPEQAAQEAQQLGIPVYTIALGTPTGYVDIMGQRINVPPDEDTLRQIAETTGGQFFQAPTARDLQAVYKDIGSRIGFVREPHDISALFAGAGAVLLVVGGALSLRWFNRFP